MKNTFFFIFLTPKIFYIITEKPVEAVQKGFSFLQERMLTDQSLLGYLSDCSALPDEIKQGMKEGQDFVSSGRAIKAILRHGLEECRKLIDFIRSSQLHAEFKEYLSKGKFIL